MNLQEIRSVLIAAVDGFEPKQEASDPLWENQELLGQDTVKPAPRAKITKLFKDQTP
jgi:hypothetical protein